MALLVGLTGGTGSGKSTMARALARCGAVVVDADALAREVVEVGSPGLAAIVEEFGPELTDETGALRRARLAEIVFADTARLRALEAITHPLIEQRTRELIAAAGPRDVVVHDMPLIVERGTAAEYHLVLVVDAPADLRVERLAGRGMPPEDARRRIAAQASTQQRRAVADVWFDNVGRADDLAEAGRALMAGRLRPYADNLVAARPADRSAAAGGPVEQWAGAGERVAARLRHALPDVDVQVRVPPEPGVLTVLLTQPVTASRLAPAGYFPAETDGFAGADPGLPVDLRQPPR